MRWEILEEHWKIGQKLGISAVFTNLKATISTIRDAKKLYQSCKVLLLGKFCLRYI